MIWRVGGYEPHEQRFELQRGTEHVAIAPKPLAVLGPRHARASSPVICTIPQEPSARTPPFDHDVRT